MGPGLPTSASGHMPFLIALFIFQVTSIKIEGEYKDTIWTRVVSHVCEWVFNLPACLLTSDIDRGEDKPERPKSLWVGGCRKRGQAAILSLTVHATGSLSTGPSAVVGREASFSCDTSQLGSRAGVSSPSLSSPSRPGHTAL